MGGKNGCFRLKTAEMYFSDIGGFGRYWLFTFLSGTVLISRHLEIGFMDFIDSELTDNSPGLMHWRLL